jgi:hypothetical protein
MQETILDRLTESLSGAANISRAAQARPAAVLWTDQDGQWQGTAARLREMLPHLFTLGDYKPAERQGPAIWLKCALARVLEEPDWPSGVVPVVYLPGVSRADLRAIEGCPRHLQPLAELQYRGVFWSQSNGRDWTLRAFLSGSRGGLALDVSGDQATRAAMLRALGALLDTPVGRLRGRRLEAGDFDALLSADPVRDLLTWMNDPQRSAADWQGPRWDAFRSRCRGDWQLDPEADGPLVAAERLADGGGGWEQVWERYSGAWRAFPNILDLLRQVQPPPMRDLFTDLGSYPRANDEAEAKLRAALAALAGLHHTAAAERIGDLETEHERRRRWLWAELGQAPLALALEPLARLASLSTRPFGGARLGEMAEAYRDELWQVDAAARQALAVPRTKADLQAVGAALRAVYLPWLTASNERFQALVRQDGYSGSELVEDRGAGYQAGGECWVFVDGLRYDVARELAERLTGDGHEAIVETAWAPVPSVTASGKVLCSPAAQVAQGRDTDRDFVPSHGTLERPLDADLLRRAISALGWQVLGPDDAGDPGGRAWTECGDLDHYGHEHGIRLAREVPVLLDEIMEQIRFLFDAGWKRLRIVTDHGWLLMPGGLPKTELHRSLTETRWGRCALLTDSAGSTDLTLTWTWCADVRIATGPGVASFIGGLEYAHGGVSLQESLIPVLRAQRAAGVAERSGVEIGAPGWLGLRCRFTVSPPRDGLEADLRRKANIPATSVAGGPKPLKDGKGSLVVADDELEGEAVSLVILDAAGQVLARVLTTIGGGD